MAIAQNFPEIAPSLDLSFALTKKLDPRVTFSRASSATYYGTQTAKAEENLLIRSQEFDDAAWVKSRLTVTANDTTAPDGTTTAELIAETTETGVHNTNQTVSFVAGLDYAFSVYAKKGTSNFIQLLCGSASVWGGRVNFDLDLGTVTAEQTATGTIVDVGNGWYRCVAVFTSGASTTTSISIAKITTSTAVRFENYTGDTANNLYAWGAQVEQRSAVTAYTPTTTQPITNYIPVLETASAGVARFDHNPLTFESLGLLVEEQRTNLVLRSEEFDNASWSAGDANGAITANAIVAPDGTLSGKLFQEDATNNPRVIRQSEASSGSNSFSVFAKNAYGSRILTLYCTNSGFSGSARIFANFDLVNGTILTTGFAGAGVFTSASITPVGNGWYRCTVVGDSLTNRCIAINASSTSFAATYQGDGFSGIFIWGASLEQGSFSTSYIKTVASQVTRSADSASMTGANFSSWYRADRGTIYCEASSFNPVSASENIAFSLPNGVSDTTGLMGIFRNDVVQVRVRGTGDGVTFATYSITPQSFAKIALAHDKDNGASTVNGVTVTEKTITPLLEASVLTIGGRGTAVSPLNGTIKKLAFYQQRLSDVQLQGLTS